MSCEACMKPCERSGLLGAINEPSLHQPGSTLVQPRKRIISCWCISTLICVAGIIMLIVKSTKPAVTPQGQLSLLNAETDDTAVLNKDDYCQSTLVLMRHCEYTDENGLPLEDEDGNKHCSKIGMERSEYVATLFGTRWPLPKLLYAMSRGRPDERTRRNDREAETLVPLRQKAGKEINVYFSAGSERLLAGEYFQHLASGRLCDKSTVICWKDSLIPTLAIALGCGVQEGCPEKFKKHWFDKVLELKYTFRTRKSTDGWKVRGKLVKEHFELSE